MTTTVDWPPARSKYTLRRKCRFERGHVFQTREDMWGQRLTACVLCGETP